MAAAVFGPLVPGAEPFYASATPSALSECYRRIWKPAPASEQPFLAYLYTAAHVTESTTTGISVAQHPAPADRSAAATPIRAVPARTKSFLEAGSIADICAFFHQLESFWSIACTAAAIEPFWICVAAFPAATELYIPIESTAVWSTAKPTIGKSSRTASAATTAI